MKKAGVCLLLSAVIAGTAFSAATVNICGYVKDVSGKPLTNTMVRLCVTRYTDDQGNNPYYTTTDSTGYYHLGSGVCQTNIIQESSMPRGNEFSHPILMGKELLFSVPQENARVKIGLYDIAGRLVKNLVDAPKAIGSYSVTISSRDIASQFYVVRVSINGVSSVLRVVPYSRGSAASVQTAPEFHASLKQLASVVDTIRATEPGYSLGVKPIGVITGQNNFVLTKTNTFTGDTAAFWGDTAAYSAQAKTANHFICKLINRTNGQVPDSLIYWADGDGGVPVRWVDQPTITLSSNAGRLYIMAGYNAKNSKPYRPNNQVWDWEEHNTGQWSYLGNLTRVDYYGMPLAMRLHCSDGKPDQVRGNIYPMFFQTRQSVFDEYINEVPQEWDTCANYSKPWKITNPCMIPSFMAANGTMAHYWDAYQKKCGVSATSCVGVNDPRISSGLFRHVLDMTDTQKKDWNNHYKRTPCSFYAYWVHRRAFYHLEYAFPYDDYNEWSSFMGAGCKAQWLIIAVGY
jgi:hypothetical protein